MARRKKLRTYTVCGEARLAFAVKVQAHSEDEARSLVENDPSLAQDHLDGEVDLTVEDVIEE